MATLREYLAANMFDGDGVCGTVTMPVRELLDEVSQLVAFWVITESGQLDEIERYYEGKD